MRNVGQLMTRTLHTVSHSVPIHTCHDLMQGHGFHHLPVVDEHGLAIGVVSDYAVTRACREGDIDDWVCEITRPIEAPAAPDDEVIPVLARQLQDRRDHTLVVDPEGRPLGIFTDRDGMALARVCVTPWLKVADVMSAGPLHSVNVDTYADKALRSMFRNDIRHLLVLNGTALKGVVSHRDLVGLAQVEVNDLTRDPMFAARADTPLESAVALMVREGIGCLPVIGERRVPVGILTRSDVLRVLTRELLQATKPPLGRR